MIWCYIKESENIMGVSKVQLEDIITAYRYKPNNREGKINDKFRDSIMDLKNNKYLYVDNKYFTNIPNKKTLRYKSIDVDESFIKLSFHELYKFYNYDGVYDVGKMLLLFSYLKSKMYRRSKTESLEQGKYEVCFPSSKMISDEIKLSTATINNYIVELNKIKLLKYIKMPDMIDKDGNVRYGSNIYTDNIETYKDELEGAYKYFIKRNKKDGFSIIKIQYNKSLGGKKSALLKKITNNTANKDDFIELENINNILYKK